MASIFAHPYCSEIAFQTGSPGSAVPSSAHNGMQRKCTVYAADSSRAECTRYVTRSARSRSLRLWKQIAMNERSRIYRWAVAWQRVAPAKGRVAAIAEGESSWRSWRTGAYMYIYKIYKIRGNTFAYTPAHSRVRSVYLRQIPPDTLLSLLYTLPASRLHRGLSEMPRKQFLRRLRAVYRGLGPCRGPPGRLNLWS